MWSIIGIFLLSWLAVGFIVGVKKVFIEPLFTKEYEEMVIGSSDNEEGKVTFSFKFEGRASILAVFTILGYLSFYFDTVDTFKKNNK